MCKVLQVSPNAYYHYLKIKDKNKQKDYELQQLIEKIFHQSRGIYGIRKIKAVLDREYNKKVSRRKISQIMKAKNLTPKARLT